MEPYFDVFGRVIPFYGILFYAGVFTAVGAAIFLSNRRNVKRYDIVYSAVFAFLGAVAGAKLLFIAVNLKEIIQGQIPFISMINGGFVFYGGLFGGLTGLLIYVKKYHCCAADFFDVYAVVIPLGHAFGRIGCFISGCCYGIACNGPFSFTYTTALDKNTPLGVPLFPVQLAEAVLLLLLFVFLLMVFMKNKTCKLLETKLYLLCYGAIRFMLEFLRGDAVRGYFLWFSTSQWISLGIILCAVMIFLSDMRRYISRRPFVS